MTAVGHVGPSFYTPRKTKIRLGFAAVSSSEQGVTVRAAAVGDGDGKGTGLSPITFDLLLLLVAHGTLTSPCYTQPREPRPTKFASRGEGQWLQLVRRHSSIDGGTAEDEDASRKMQVVKPTARRRIVSGARPLPPHARLALLGEAPCGWLQGP